MGAKEDGQSVIVTEGDDALPTAEGGTTAAPQTKQVAILVPETHKQDEEEDDDTKTNTSAAVDRPARNRSPTATVRNAVHENDDEVDESIDYDVTCGIFRSLSRASAGSSSDTTTSQSDTQNTSRRQRQRRKSMQDAMHAISAAEFVITGHARVFCSPHSSSSPTRPNTTHSQDGGTTSSGDDTNSSQDTSLPSSKGSLQSLWDSLPTACGRSSLPDEDEEDTATNTAVSPSCSLDAHRLTCVNPVATTLMQLWNEQQQQQHDTTTSSTTTTGSTMNDETKLEEEPPILLPALTTASSTVTTTTPTTSFEDPTHIHTSPTPLTPPKREFSCDLKQVYGFDRVANLTLQRPTPVQATAAGAAAAAPGNTPLDRLFTCIE